MVNRYKFKTSARRSLLTISCQLSACKLPNVRNGVFVALSRSLVYTFSITLQVTQVAEERHVVKRRWASVHAFSVD